MIKYGFLIIYKSFTLKLTTVKMVNPDHRGNNDVGVSCGTINARAESSPLLA